MQVKDLMKLGEYTGIDISIRVRFQEMVIVESIKYCYEKYKNIRGWDEDTPVSKIINVYLIEMNFIETDSLYDKIESISIDNIDE